MTQSRFAQWWAARNASTLRVQRVAADRLRLHIPLDGAVILAEGRPTASDLEVSCDRDFDMSHLALRVPDRLLEVTKSLTAHLGCRHVSVSTGDDPALARLVKALDGHLENRRAVRAYSEDFLRDLSDHIDQVHRDVGLPALKIGPLPTNAAGDPYRVAFSPRFDVDKAIVNVPLITALHQRFGVRGTFYLRVSGMFYGDHAIQQLARSIDRDELALHGEFVTTAEQRSISESEAAIVEKVKLESLVGRSISGLCTHGGELRANQTDRTPAATDSASFLYETTFYERPYHHPMYLPSVEGLRPTLTILRQDDDVSLPADNTFATAFAEAFEHSLDRAEKQVGVFVPTMHPLYFDLTNYLSHPKNLGRMVRAIPTFVSRAARMRQGQLWENQDALSSDQHNA